MIWKCRLRRPLETRLMAIARRAGCGQTKVKQTTLTSGTVLKYKNGRITRPGLRPGKQRHLLSL